MQETIKRIEEKDQTVKDYKFCNCDGRNAQATTVTHSEACYDRHAPTTTVTRKKPQVCSSHIHHGRNAHYISFQNMQIVAQA